MINERQFEDILCKYPELIEEGLVFKGRQITIYNRRMDILFEDGFERKLIVELKVGPIKDDHIGQILSYEGMLLSADDPAIRVMLVGTRVPPNIQKALDHHGIAWREITISRLKEFLTAKGDQNLIEWFAIEEYPNNVTKINKAIERDVSPGKIRANFQDRSGLIDKLRNSVIYKDFKTVVSSKAKTESAARDLIKENLGKLNIDIVKRVLMLVDENHVTNAFSGKYRDGPWFGRLLHPNARWLLNEDQEKINQWFAVVCNETLSAEERLRSLSKEPYCIRGINVGFISLVLYLLNKDRYSVWFQSQHEGLSLFYNDIGAFSGQPGQYKVFNTAAKEFIKEFNFEHTELDFILWNCLAIVNGRTEFFYKEI